jgi:proteasome accessory factor B
VRLNLNEAVALFFAARLLAHHIDEHNPNVVSALTKLAAGLPDTTISSHMARVAEIIRARPLRADYVRVLDAVTRAWADRRKLAIRYRAASGELTERVICPYFLEVSRSEPASYVIAYDDLRAALRTFKLERVAEASLLDEGYSIPDDFDPYQHLASAWGVMDETEVEVCLRFSPLVAPRVRESVWHHSQRLENTDDGGCELRMRVGGIREVRSWVLGWGADVEVLAPAALRDDVRTGTSPARATSPPHGHIPSARAQQPSIPFPQIEPTRLLRPCYDIYRLRPCDPPYPLLRQTPDASCNQNNTNSPRNRPIAARLYTCPRFQYFFPT